jgi:hypothetical protein
MQSMCFRKLFFLFMLGPAFLSAQHITEMKLVKVSNENRIDVYADDVIFTSFLYPDSLEKPVLYPIYDAGNTLITRGFPMKPRPGEPTDHPHHLGLWFNYENVNGLDFWNNSYAIPADKKHLYGWIKTDSIVEITDGPVGILRYHARWVDQKNRTILEENTRFEFSGSASQRIIDRITELKADTAVLFADAKDGLLGLRLTRELQIPNTSSQQFVDNKGNKTKVKADAGVTGNYLTSEGRTGDSAWSTRGQWCKVFGKIGKDSVSITIFDHPENPNYPTFWHARGYGLFAANPLGEKIFTNGKSSLNLALNKNDTRIFRYRILIQNGQLTPSAPYLNNIAEDFQKQFTGN